MKEKISLALEIITWGLIGIAIFITLLRPIGIIHHAKLTLENLPTIGMLLLLGEMRVKMGLLWEDF